MIDMVCFVFLTSIFTLVSFWVVLSILDIPLTAWEYDISPIVVFRARVASPKKINEWADLLIEMKSAPSAEKSQRPSGGNTHENKVRFWTIAELVSMQRHIDFLSNELNTKESRRFFCFYPKVFK